MPSLIEGYQYDIFVSYRHNDNRSGWVTEFVQALQEELAAAIKDPVSVYFDTNPHDGLLETHHVDKSLEGKLKCLILIPILSQTYCDRKSFAWQYEFCAFNRQAKDDISGRDIRLSNGNIASRILPVKIHNLEAEDIETIENEMGSVLRAVDFIYKVPGVNRPLTRKDDDVKEITHTLFYRDQINKVANAVKEITNALRVKPSDHREPGNVAGYVQSRKSKWAIISIPLIIILLAIAGFFLIPGWLQRRAEGPVSIAIIPFHNQTRNSNFDGYGFGMASEIRTQLALSGQFNFISADQATLKYADSNLSPKEIASELNVDYLLFGSFYQLGDQVKMSAELSKGETNKSLWSLAIDLSTSETVDELFDIQAKIAQRVMNWFSLRGKIENHAPTKNLTAYQYYLEATESAAKGLVPIAADLFRKAIELDGSFHAAYVGLFLSEDAKLWEHGTDTLVRPNDLRPLLDRIEELSPDSWETYFAKGVFYYHQMKDYEKGLEYLERSIQVNPEASDPLSYAGAVNRRRLNLKGALQYQVKEIEMNPRSATLWNELALTLGNSGNADGAIQAELISKRLGMKREFNYSIIFNYAARDSMLYELPADVKQYFGTDYEAYLAKEKRDWRRLLAIADTTDSDYPMLHRNMDKAFANYFKGDLASAALFAKKALDLQDLPEGPFVLFLPVDIYVLMNENEKAFAAVNDQADELMRNSHQGQDKGAICRWMIDQIIQLSFAGKYEEATRELILLNERYPAWGDYGALTGFRIDRIRKEYPPFNAALKNLKRPPLIKFPEQYRDM